MLEEETIVFLDHYLDQRTVVQKVFDPHGNDFETYQARELSYLFDFLDAQWLRALFRAGMVLFIPPSALLASILTWAVFARGSARAFPALPAMTRSLVLLVLLTNYVFLTTMGLFYRATKPLLVPVLLGALFFLWTRLRASAEPAAPTRDFLADARSRLPDERLRPPRVLLRGRDRGCARPLVGGPPSGGALGAGRPGRDPGQRGLQLQAGPLADPRRQRLLAPLQLPADAAKEAPRPGLLREGRRASTRVRGHPLRRLPPLALRDRGGRGSRRCGCDCGRSNEAAPAATEPAWRPVARPGC